MRTARRLILVGFAVLCSGAHGASHSRAMAVLGDLECGDTLVVADFSTTPVVAAAARLKEIANGFVETRSMPEHMRREAAELMDRLDVYAKDQFNRGGRKTGLARALATYVELLDAQWRLEDANLLPTIANIASVVVKQGCRDGALKLIATLEESARERAREDGRYIPGLVGLLYAKAAALIEGGQYTEAMPLLGEIQELSPDGDGIVDPDFLKLGSLVNRSVALRRLARLAEAQELLDEAVEFASTRYGPRAWQTGYALNALLVFHRQTGTPVDLGPLHDRLVDVRLAHHGDRSADTAVTIANRGAWRSSTGDVGGAERDFRDALEILARAGIAEGERALSVRLHLASLLDKTGREEEAQREYDAAISMAQDLPGLSPVRRARLHHEYATFLVSRAPGAAEEHYSEAITLRREALGADHPSLAESLSGRGRARLGSTDGAEAALEDLLAASYVYATWLEREASGCRTGEPPRAEEIRDTAVSTLLLAALLSNDLAPSAKVDHARHMLLLVQIASANSVSAALAQAALRLGVGPAFRDYQEAVARQCELDAVVRRLQASGHERESSVELGEAIARSTKLNARIAELAGQLDPVLVERQRASEALVSSSRLQTLLSQGDILVVFVVVDALTIRIDLERVEEGLKVGAFVNGELTQDRLSELTRRLRASTGPESVFDMDASRTLNAELFREFDPWGDGHVFIVPDGGIDRLSFASLIDEQGTWFGDRYRHSLLPSVGSLVHIAELRTGSNRTSRFQGIGDPAMGPVCNADMMKAFLSRGDAFGSSGEPVASAEAVRGLCSLRYAGAELEAVARAVGNGRDSLLTAENATESKVRAHDFSGVGILVLATHAEMAHSRLNLPEPALILTPENDASRISDGVVLASEIAGLKLDDVWLAALSACNTSAGESGGEGLTGLARAFLFAGVETLLVSHWAVDDAATSKLLEALFEDLYGADAPSVSESLRRAMIEVRRTQPNPYYWGAFAVAGDGKIRRP